MNLLRIREVFLLILLKQKTNMEKKLTRATGKDAMFMGICAGLGKYFDLDATIVRILVALVTFFSFGSLILVYFILAFIIPKDDATSI